MVEISPALRSAQVSGDVYLSVWNVSDEALLAGLAAGDRHAALILVRRFQARVFGLALSITGDRTSAEEAAQDAFVKAWRYAASYDPRRGSVAAWLLSIARNAALDQARARGRRLDRPGSDATDAIIGVAGADGINSPYEDLSVVADGIRALPEEQRAVLIAAVYTGFTTNEISEAWKLPLGTVKTRLRLALSRLRDITSEVAR